MAALVQRGERFTRRWFTAEEVAECVSSGDPVGSFALRFAAKEAAWKAIGVAWDGPVPWLSIAISRSDETGRSFARLDGAVADAARTIGVESIGITTHAGERFVIAIAIAERNA